MGITNENDLYREPYMMSSTHCKRCCSNSQSIFTPLKSKMKNIRKRIGLGSNLHSPNCSQRNLQPVRFSPVHGENITLNKDRSIAKRSNSFCKAITFSDRPIKIEEKIYIKFIELSDAWSGSIRFGFTSRNPGSLKGQLPKYMCPDLTNEKGFWGKAVNERDYAYLNNVMYFYVSKSGNVYCGIEGRSKELLFDHVDVSRHLWMMIDVYGNTMAIELVSLQLNNSLTADQEAGFGLINNIRSTGSLDSVLETDFSRMTLHNERPPCYSHVDASVSHITGVVTTNLDKLKNIKRPQETKRVPHNLILTPLPFHEKHGVNIRLSNDRLTANRTEREYSKGYVFSPRPIGPNEFVVVQILKTENSYAGGIAFGMTSKNPATIDPLYLPEDSDTLLDCMDSFYVHKNVANSPSEGDILIFSLNEEGEVRMKKNGELQMTVFHVERNLPYWWFFDLYGSTIRVRAYSGVAERPSCEIIKQNSMVANNQRVGGLPYSSVVNNAADKPIETNLPISLPVSVPQSTMYGNAPILVLNCSINGNRNSFEPLRIVIQNQADGRSSQIIASPQETSQVMVRSVENYAPIENLTTVARKQIETYDCSSDNGKNREHQLQEWAKTTWRQAPNSSTQNDCIVCYEKPVDCVLYRCGHMCMCYECARELWRGRGDGHCPYCRAVIRDVVRTYKS